MDAAALLEKAMDLINSGNVIEAKEFLNQIVDDYPDSEESEKAQKELHARFIYEPVSKQVFFKRGLKIVLIGAVIFIGGILGIGVVFWLLETTNTTPLHEAVEARKLESISTLIEQGSNINSKDYWENAPIHLAVKNGHLEIVELLLNLGANINAKGMFGDSPLKAAVRNNDLKIVKYLIERGASVNQANLRGDTPLHDAAGLGNVNIAEMLLKAGADVESKGSAGRRPIHNAAANGHLSTLIFLAENGAGDSRWEDNKYSPWRLAIISGHQDIIEYYLDRYAFQWVSQLTDWNNAPNALSELYDRGWKPKSISDKIHVYVVNRNKNKLLELWPETRKVLLDDVATLKRLPIENALYAFIGIGKREIIPSLVDILVQKGNTTLAEAYLNSGLEELNQAATKWAQEKGYEITRGPGANPVKWGAM